MIARYALVSDPSKLDVTGVKDAGHGQLEIGFTNEIEDHDGHLFHERGAPNAPKRALPGTYLIAKVSWHHSNKFNAFLAEARRNDPGIREASAALEKAQQELQEMHHRYDEYFASIPGYLDLQKLLKPLRENINLFTQELNGRRVRPHARRIKERL